MLQPVGLRLRIDVTPGRELRDEVGHALAQRVREPRTLLGLGVDGEVALGALDLLLDDVCRLVGNDVNDIFR